MKTGPDIARLIDDRPDAGVFRVHRDAFRDPAVFEREIERLFEGGWVYVGHASQLPQPHDYLTAVIGRQPVVLMRDADGALGCFLNTCRHKGALVCHHGRGNRRAHVCHYHGWSFASSGRNVAIKARAAGAYSDAFDGDCHDLQPVAHFGEYRGFLFASLAPDTIPLAQHLGDARIFIDMVADQSEDGIELVPGTVTYTFRGNWKLQLENSVDAYHFTSTHPSYLRLLDRRAAMAARPDAAAAIWQGDGGRAVEETMGSFGFPQGHALAWTTSPVERHPLYESLPALRERVGALRADWMLRTRQFNLFPNLQLASNAALQMRVIRPLAVDLTEISSYCVAPVGEPPQKRRQRLRQYEDFFNPSGLATPDDTVTFEDCQAGFACGAVQWQQGYMRGITRVAEGPDEHARALGITPSNSVNGSFAMADETVFHAMYRAWARRLA
ncbi:MAG: Rieske 2Fe-2S domain-containing protein [Burkholderiales bacterium]|nr:MAG: Rieske 2Fe-2S domain-containing protein [Burkholderiales bacterium]